MNIDRLNGWNGVELLEKVIRGEITLRAQANVIHCWKRLDVSEGTLKDEDGRIYG
jgi:hypothetical protein